MTRVIAAAPLPFLYYADDPAPCLTWCAPRRRGWIQ